MKPMEIERASLAIIESELTYRVPDEVKPIVLRVIHATADFSFAQTLRFSPDSVAHMRQMLIEGATLITDTQMALMGINKAAAAHLGITVKCFMSDPDVAQEALARGVTRATVSMERALALPGAKLFVCGNAPTFLLRLMEAHEKSPLRKIAVIAAPVGFVNVVEAKALIWKSGLTCIAAMGRRGGSSVAAAIVNALMYGIKGVR